MAAPKTDDVRDGVRPGISTSELWLSVAGGGGIYEIATIDGGPTMEQAICAVALAIAAVGYAIARAHTKRC